MIPGFASIKAALIFGAIAVLAVLAQEYRVNNWKTKAFEAQKIAAEIQAKNDALAGALELQNDRVQKLEQQAKVMARDAQNAADNVRKHNEPLRRAIETAGAGPREMNQWLENVFSP